MKLPSFKSLLLHLTPHQKRLWRSTLAKLFSILLEWLLIFLLIMYILFFIHAVRTHRSLSEPTTTTQP